MLVTDVSGISSEGGTLDMGTKSTLQLYLDSRMGICEEHMGMRACLPLHLHPKRVCVRAHTQTPASFRYRLHGTNRLPSLFWWRHSIPTCAPAGASRPTALSLCPWHSAPCQASASPGHSPGHLRALSAKFPGLGDSYFPFPGAFGVPRAWCPPHRLSMIPWTLSR